MASKRSFFKPVLIQNNIKRFWPAWTLHLILLFFVVIMPVYNTDSETGEMAAFRQAFDCLTAACNPIVIFCFSILFSLLVFSWMYSARSCNMMHAFPFKRSQLFLANYASGLGFLIVPQIIMFAAAMPGCLYYGLTPGTVGSVLLFAIACDFIFFTIAVLCCMLAGHLLSGLVYILIFNSVYVIARMLFMTIQFTYGYGLTGNVTPTGGKGNFLSPVVYITANCEPGYDTEAATISDALSSARIEGGMALLVYCIVSVGILLAAMLLYRKRHLECAGEMSAYHALNPVIRWIVGICCGVATGVFLATLVFDRGYIPETFRPMVILTVVFTLVWFVIAEMVLKKTFRIFKPGIWMEWGVMCALTLCLIGAIKADAFHTVSHVPEPGEVAAVSVEGNYVIASSDSRDIQKTIDLQKAFLENRESYEEAQKNYYQTLDHQSEDIDESTLRPVTITYFLHDGSALERMYYLPLTKEAPEDPSGAAVVLDEMETPESAMRMMLGNDYSSIHFTRAVLDGAVIEEEGAQELFDALEKDLEEGNIHYRTKDLLKRRVQDGMYLDDSISISLTGTVDGRYHCGMAGMLGASPDETPGDSTFEDGYYYAGKHYFAYGGNNISPAETAYVSATDQTNVSIDFWINSECENTCEVLMHYGVITDPSDLDQMLEESLEGYTGLG